MIQRLKAGGFITGSFTGREPHEYQGRQAVYALTKAGKAAVAATREYYLDETWAEDEDGRGNGFAQVCSG